MYISARQRRKILVSIILIVVLAIALSVLIFSLLRPKSELEDVSFIPENIVLSNVGENSVTVTWTTGMKSSGMLTLFEDNRKVGDFDDVKGSDTYFTHNVRIDGLKPGTQYEFEIFSEGEKFLRNDGNRFVFSTAEVSAELPNPKIVNGEIQISRENDVLLFVVLDDGSDVYPLSANISTDGKWSLDLANFEIFDNVNVRADSALKILIYSKNGSSIVEGNRNVLFDDDGNYQDGVLSLGSTRIDIFAEIPNIAMLENVFQSIEEVEITPEIVEMEEDVLGAEEEDGVVVWETLDKNERLTDYGIY